MNRLYFLLAALAMLIGTLISGLVHGHAVNRFGQRNALRTASVRLGNSLPQYVGGWRLIQAVPIDDSVKRTLQCTALQGIYSHEATGHTAVVALLAGPSGPLTAHSPEICYSAQDYEIADERQELRIRDADGTEHAVWMVHGRSRHATRPSLQIVYSWNRGTAWQAVRGPRFALAGLPLLYKLQLAVPADAQPLGDFDPCQDFLSHFLSAIEPRLIAEKPASRPT